MIYSTFTRLLLGVGLIAIGGLISPVMIIMQGGSLTFGTFLPLIVLVVFIGALGYFYFYGGRQAFSNLPVGVRSPATGEISPSGILWQTEVATTTFKRQAFTHYVEGVDIVLLYQGAAATLLPRSFFADEAAWTAALDLIHTHLPDKRAAQKR